MVFELKGDQLCLVVIRHTIVVPHRLVQNT